MIPFPLALAMSLVAPAVGEATQTPVPPPCYGARLGPVSPRLPLGRAGCPGPLPIVVRSAAPEPVAPEPVAPEQMADALTLEPGGAPLNIGGVDIYLLAPEVIVRPAEVTVAAPQVHFLPPAPPPAYAPATPEPR